MQQSKTSKFFIQVSISIGIIAAFNLLVIHLSKNSIPRQILRTAQSSETVTDIFVGNSLMQAGFNTKVFEANLSNRKAINLGLGSSSPVEHYLLLKSTTRQSKTTIYYGFFDTQLTDQITSDYDSLFGNRAASYYIEPETAILLYAPNDFIKAWQLRLTGKVPMLVERAALWANIERIRRSIGSIGVPSTSVNQFGRTEDFQILEPINQASFAQLCKSVVQNKVAFNSGINSILKLANQRSTETIFILMPMTKKHRDRFYAMSEWQDYYGYLNNLLNMNGGSLINASDWIADDGFSDGLHLNDLGAKLFSEKIAAYKKTTYLR